MSNLTVRGNASGTGTIILESPNTNSNRTITLPDATATLATTADLASIGITLGTAVASTSGTAIDFTGIPSTAKRVTVMLDGVSLSGVSNALVQLGSGSVQTTGYVSGSSNATATNGFIVTINDEPRLIRAVMTISRMTGNSWIESGSVSFSAGGTASFAGSVSLSGALDRVRITTVNGTDTFDAGTINIMWEG